MRLDAPLARLQTLEMKPVVQAVRFRGVRQAFTAAALQKPSRRQQSPAFAHDAAEPVTAMQQDADACARFQPSRWPQLAGQGNAGNQRMGHLLLL